MLLQAGQLLSTAGTQLTTIAYPLFVLVLTHPVSMSSMRCSPKIQP